MYKIRKIWNPIGKLIKGDDFVDTAALVLVIIGALNWGSIGLFGIDLVATVFGGQFSIVSRIIYTLVGLAGIWSITLLFKDKPVKDSDHM